MSNYPLGADNDPRAPWNQTDLPDKDIEVYASNTLSRPATIHVNDYKVEPPDAERDEDGFVTYYENIDYRDCDLLGQFKEQHYTLKELLDCIVKVTADINSRGLTDQNLHLLNHLSREAEAWEEDEVEVVLN